MRCIQGFNHMSQCWHSLLNRSMFVAVSGMRGLKQERKKTKALAASLEELVV